MLAIFFVLLIFFVLACVALAQSMREKKEAASRDTVFKEVSKKFSGAFFVFNDKSGYPLFIRFKDVFPSSGASCGSNNIDIFILASVDKIYWDDDESSIYHGFNEDHIYGFKVREYSRMQMNREFSWEPSSIMKAIDVGMEMQNYRAVDINGLESRLCELLFENIHESTWALNKLNLLNRQIENLGRVREQCKSNELLQPHYKKVIRAARVLADQRVELNSYWHDAQESAKKIYEYLSVPAAIKDIDKLNLDPLKVSLKRSELQDSFQKVQELHKELDQL